MEIGWGNGNQEMKGFERMEMYVGEENVCGGRESIKELGSFTITNEKPTGLV